MLVIIMDVVCRTTKNNLKKYLAEVAKGENPMLVCKGLGYAKHITDITPDEAKDWLEEMKRNEKKKKESK